jgi:hypothetical protein
MRSVLALGLKAGACSLTAPATCMPVAYHVTRSFVAYTDQPCYLVTHCVNQGHTLTQAWSHLESFLAMYEVEMLMTCFPGMAMPLRAKSSRPFLSTPVALQTQIEA